jgi:hypothetical protein
MSDAAAVPDPGSMRASQDDRERVSRALNRATNEGRLTSVELAERLDRVPGAVTIGELNNLVADLPGQDLLAPVPRSQPASPAHLTGPASGGAPDGVVGSAPAWDLPTTARIGGVPGSTSAVAIMGGATREGNWVVPPAFRAVAVMGGIELDLTSATFAAPEATIEAYTLMGGVEITVPPDITVVVHGGAFMGGFSDSVHQQGPPGAPVLHVTGFALMGGVDVGRRRKMR